MRFLGPYLRPDGRKHLIVINSDGSKTSKSWSKHVLEEKIGRELKDWETADHIDNDKTNDHPDNLQVLSQEDNARKEINRGGKREEIYSFICPVCEMTSAKPAREVRRNSKKGKTGPFCSRDCAGKSQSRILPDGTYYKPNLTLSKEALESLNLLKF